MIVDIFAYVADAAILGTYAASVRDASRVRWFHWANAIGAVPIVAVEIVVAAWPPLVLTVAFGLIGCAGVLRGTP